MSQINNRYQVANQPYIQTDAFNFAAQTPGVVLSSGITNTITISPVPLGVNSTDTNHYLYISGGTGTAEVVLITGGSAIAGSATGTISFVPNFNHSGAWTIQSASGGVQEAFWGRGSISRIIVPSGSIILYAPVTFQNANLSFRGAGQGVTTFITTATPSTANPTGAAIGDWLYFNNPIPPTGYLFNYIDLGGFSIVDSAATMHTSGSMIHVKGKTLGEINNIEIENGYDGLIMDNCPGSPNVHGIHIGAERHALYITTMGQNYPTVAQSGGAYSDIFLANITDACLQIEGPTSSITFSDIVAASVPPAVGNYVVQYVVDATNPAGEVMFVNCIFDSASQAIRLVGPTTATYNENWIIFTGCELNATEGALTILGAIQNIYWNGGLIKASGGTNNLPIDIEALSSGIPKNIQIRNVSIYGTGTEAFQINSTGLITISGVAVGYEGSGPTTFMNIANNVSVVIENCDFTNCTVSKITRTGGASFANIRIVDFSNAFAFADLQAFQNGSTIMVKDGTTANPVASGGSGCLAKRLNGVWVGN